MIQESDKDELILKVLDGIATPDEIQTLARWMETDPSNEVYFDQLKKAWNLTSGPIPSEERVEHELGNYMEYIRSKHRKYSIGLLLKYAAIVMIPLLSVIYWLQLEKDEIPSQMAVGNPGIIPGEHKAMLITAQGQTIALLPSQERDICVQEDFVVKNGQAGIVYQDSKKAVSTLQYNTLKTPRGGEYTVVLSDGTKVYLNAASELKYPVQFDSKKRQVHLSGEAYFEVARNERCPFVVRTHAMDVEVLGTKFNVEAYSKKAVFEASLMQGKIRVKSPLNEKAAVVLLPNYKTILKDGRLVVSKIDDYNVYRWKEGLYCFKSKPFIQIMEDLERYYDMKIQVDKKSIESVALTGKFRISDGLDYALRVLQKDVSFTYRRDKDNDVIYIK